MMGNSHMLLGATFAATYAHLNGVSPLDQPTLFGALVGLGGIAGLLPDLDAGNSTIFQMTGLSWSAWHRARPKRLSLGILFNLLLWLLRGVGTGIVQGFFGLFKHRGPLHSGLLPMAFGALAWFLGGSTWGIVIGGGVMTHLLADMSTKSGVPVLWPVTRKSFHILPRRMRLTTGSMWETVLVGMIVIAGITPLWLDLADRMKVL